MRTDSTTAISLLVLVSDFVLDWAGRSISGGNLLDADHFHLKESALKSDPGMYNVRTIAGHTYTHTHTHPYSQSLISNSAFGCGIVKYQHIPCQRCIKYVTVMMSPGNTSLVSRCRDWRSTPSCSFGREARVCTIAGGSGFNSRHVQRRGDKIAYDDIRMTVWRDWMWDWRNIVHMFYSISKVPWLYVLRV
jgi:hypothetical protein